MSKINILLYLSFFILFLNFCESGKFYSDCKYYNRTGLRVSNRCERDENIIVEERRYRGERYWCIAINNDDYIGSSLKLKIGGAYQIWTSHSLLGDNLKYQINDKKTKIVIYKFDQTNEFPKIDSLELNNEELCIDSNRNGNSLFTEDIECGEKIGESNWPWHVQIMKRDDPDTTLCYGTIISDSYILTSYNCFKTNKLPEQFIVTLANRRQIGVIQIKTPINYLYDIVLLKLVEQIVFDNTIKPACFPQPDMSFLENGHVTGINLTKAEYIQENLVCRKNSGSGFYQNYNNKWYISGISSYALKEDELCTEKIVFTDVLKHSSWIQNELKYIL